MAIFLSRDYVRNLQPADVQHVVISALSASARFSTTMQSFVKNRGWGYMSREKWGSIFRSLQYIMMARTFFDT